MTHYRKSFFLIAGALCVALISCGPSAEEKAAAEKAKQDSIAAAQKAVQDSIAAAVQKATQDSMLAAAAAEKAREDSIEAAEAKAKANKPKPKTKEEKQIEEVKKATRGRG